MSYKLEDLDVDGVVKVLENWDMAEFAEFAREKEIDGRKLTEVTEGLVKLWRPRADAKKFMIFTEDLKNNPEKYLKQSKDSVITIKETNLCIDSPYQTVSVRKISHDASNFNRVEDILKKIVAPKSFLYRNHRKTERAVTSYVPMDAGTGKKPKKFFRLSSYDYPIFDFGSKLSKPDSTDRGYYSVKPSTKFYVQKSYKKIDPRPKYKSLGTTEELNDKMSDEHFYEDLCYYDMDKDKNKTAGSTSVTPNQAKPRLVKIQELFQSFQSFRLPFFKKNEEVSEKEVKVENDTEKVGPIYENNDSIVDMYDSIHVHKDEGDCGHKEKDKAEATVEDYLEPVQVSKDYCDVGLKQKEESLLGFILSYFETRFGRRVAMCWWIKVSVPLVHNLGVRVGNTSVDCVYRLMNCLTDVIAETNDATVSEDSDAEKEICDKEPTWDRKQNMADRPLPVPVESEPYYMNVDRSEAENLLRGQPDGTFVLRPSSQPNHAYTLSVACANSVHNVGVRRRPDGRLALGFPRRGERSFASVTSLLRHHKKRRLMLVAGGDVIGGTTLNDTPHYYQTPSNIPITQIRQ